MIPEVELKSLQGDCMEKKKEGECTSKVFRNDIKITNKDVGSCSVGETSFESDPKEYFKSDLLSHLEPQN